LVDLSRGKNDDRITVVNKNIHEGIDRRKEAFKVEKYRHQLASLGKLNVLKTKYSRNFPSIENLNTGKFWDQRIDESVDHKPEDGMTRERVEIAYRFMPRRARVVLDIGAGYGYVERFLNKDKDIKIYGNDISRNAIQNLKKRFKGSFKLESLYKMKYKSGFFDAIFMLEVLEHVTPSKTLGLLADIKRMLKKRGYLILSVPMNEGLEEMKDNPNGHVRMYTQDLIKAELEIAGFNILAFKTLYAFNTQYMFKKIISKILRNKWIPNNIIVLAQAK
jgi:2-polyprenyl-3-methyl-5-hydroxy-6-metoxy-1,4-benzoquinol methylase